MLKPLIVLSFLFLLPGIARAYPEFIGYGYTSCVTCHYNTQGMGPLNDYGRALFAGEIASRAFFDESTTDDELGASSGFLGKKELPWWLRPSIKYRQIWVDSNPGSSSDNHKQLYLMQEDGNLTLLLDKDQHYVFQGNLSLVNRPGTDKNPDGSPVPTQVWLSREHYLRINWLKSLFISIGMLDKVFGIRQIDHTAFSRTKLGINQYDNTIGTMTHGVVTQWNTPEHEFTLHLFTGNLNEDDAIRSKGGSFMAEFQTAEKSVSGFSLLSQANSTVKEQAVAIHQKLGLSLGSAFLSELGYHRTEDSSVNSQITGYYLEAQTNILLVRGYSLLNLAEYYKSRDQNSDKPDQYRWGLGLLTFPMPRTEFRFMLEDYRFWSEVEGNKDSWVALLQLHLSL